MGCVTSCTTSPFPASQTWCSLDTSDRHKPEFEANESAITSTFPAAFCATQLENYADWVHICSFWMCMDYWVTLDGFYEKRILCKGRRVPLVLLMGLVRFFFCHS